MQVKRLQTTIQQRDAQYKHEMKKKERELVKLKDKMHQLLTDKNHEKCAGTVTDKNHEKCAGTVTDKNHEKCAGTLTCILAYARLLCV